MICGNMEWRSSKRVACKIWRTIIPNVRGSFDEGCLTSPPGIFPKIVSLTSNVSKSFHKVYSTNQWHKILIEINLNAFTKIFLNLLDPVYSQHTKHFLQGRLCTGLERQTFVGPRKIRFWSQKLKEKFNISFLNGFEVPFDSPMGFVTS